MLTENEVESNLSAVLGDATCASHDLDMTHVVSILKESPFLSIFIGLVIKLEGIIDY